MNLYDKTNYLLNEGEVDEQFGDFVRHEQSGCPYYVNPTVEELEKIRAMDMHGDIRVGIEENGRILCWPASAIMHDSMEKQMFTKFRFRATIMKHEDLGAMEQALVYFSALKNRPTSNKDDAVLRKKVCELMP